MPRLLIIDDEPQMLKMLHDTFVREGYDVDDAVDGKEGIKKYRQNPYDLIITDIIMPEKEGLELITELKRDFPDIKIIAISGGGRIQPDMYLKLADKVGAVRTFCKPVERRELIETVREVLNQ